MLDEACVNFTKHGYTQFTPDVYTSLIFGQAELHIGFFDGKPAGLVTFYSINHPGQNPSLHIWHGYILPGTPPAGLQGAFDFISQKAKEKNCDKLVFTTGRKGWERAAKRSGFKFASSTYERNV
jgi:hypothetical protein